MISLIILTACGTLTSSKESKPAPPIPNEACLEFKPIFWRRVDMVITPDNETKKQIDEHNAVWKRLCGR